MMDIEVDPKKPDFTGYYEHTRSEQYDDFLRILGINWLARKFAAGRQPTYTLYHNKNLLRMIFVNGPSTRERFMRIGEEHEGTDWMGNASMVSVYWDDWKLVEDHKPLDDSDAKPVKITLELMGADTLVFKMEVEGIVCKRFFRRRRKSMYSSDY